MELLKKILKKPTKKKTVKKSTAKKKAFGGYYISFKGCTDTVEDVFGKEDLAPSAMTKKIWEYVKKNKLSGKK